MTENASGSTALELLAKKLKNTRMERNLSIDDVSRMITVPKSYLEKIEAGDFSFLPKAYIIAFIKKYAILMDVGSDDTFEQCKNELQRTGAPKREVSIEPGVPKTGTSQSWSKTLQNLRLSGSFLSLKIGIAFVVLAGLVVFYMLGKEQVTPSRPSGVVALPSPTTDDTVAVAEQIVDSLMIAPANKPEAKVASVPPDNPSQSSIDSVSSAVSVASATPAPAPPVPVSQVVAVSAKASSDKEWAKNVSFTPSSRSSPYRKILVVRLVEDYSWVKVVADDSARVYAGGQFKNGQVLRYEAHDKFWVNIGRPKYVELYLNGKKIPPFTDRILILK
ncbi:MAG: DUF4115 domain-containing protein [Chlorobiales bacterium]|nr:DUF4115 domain-containing protein [Chlorobiales bacterium]